MSLKTLSLAVAALALPLLLIRVLAWWRLARREQANQVQLDLVKHRIREEGDRVFNLTPVDLQELLRKSGYHLDWLNTQRLWSYMRQGKPIGLRGEPGIGKSLLPETLAAALGYTFVDLECHSQLEADEIGIAWNGFRQIVDAQIPRPAGEPPPDLYTLDYLNNTPLLESLLQQAPTVVRIDEVDKLNERTTNFFLRYLDRKELVVPGLSGGSRPIKAQAPLFVFLTSNEYKRLDPAFMRRIAWIELEFPSENHLVDILVAKVGVPADFAARVAKVIVQLRQLELEKKPAISEALEWARALMDAGDGEITPGVLEITIGYLAKYKEDEALVREALKRWYEGFYRVA